jgi:hypothetical protein
MVNVYMGRYVDEFVYPKTEKVGVCKTVTHNCHTPWHYIPENCDLVLLFAIRTYTCYSTDTKACHRTSLIRFKLPKYFSCSTPICASLQKKKICYPRDFPTTISHEYLTHCNLLHLTYLIIPRNEHKLQSSTLQNPALTI